VTLPLPWESLRALLGEEFGDARLASVARVALRSRNALYRARLDDAPYQSVVVKVVRQEDDRFWEHHLRREHWLLQLLARFWPGGAPRPFAAAMGVRWGLLVMEDVGTVSLAERLGGGAPAGEPWEASLLGDALARLTELHALLRQEHRLFQRVCRSVELDRVTATSLRARLRVAHARLGGDGPGPATAAALPLAVLQRYTERVVRPLLSGRRQMIHNSLSPLNIVLGPAPRFVDWETMAYAAPEFDVADLLRYPATNIPWPAVDQLVAAALGPTFDPVRLRLAALARSLDYAGSNAQQAARSRDAGDAGHEALATARRDWYLREGQTLAEELGLAGLVERIVR
jgi:Ser/Thr protein kinase RdoA (MazF antagonist)